MPKKCLHGESIGEVIAQGDVLLVRVAALPTKWKQTVVPKDRGFSILAYGEVTGHAHVVADATAELLSLEEEKYLIVKQATDLIHGTIPADGVVESLPHPEHSTVTLAPGTYKVLTQSTYAWGEATRVLD